MCWRGWYRRCSRLVIAVESCCGWMRLAGLVETNCGEVVEKNRMMDDEEHAFKAVRFEVAPHLSREMCQSVSNEAKRVRAYQRRSESACDPARGRSRRTTPAAGEHGGEVKRSRRTVARSGGPDLFDGLHWVMA